MYQQYFGLAEAPFSIAPDPRYLYLSERHQEALAHLLYGVNGEGGFVLLTGEVGAGKTTVCRCLLEQIPATCDVAFVFNPKLTVEELLSAICVEFGIACPEGNSSVKGFVDRINAHLLAAHAQGRHAVLIIDEAQNLSPDVLEQMRLLTNLETNRRKLLQIILLGQPELATMLARPDLRQLAQRIVARYHLGPLAPREVAAYVEHRLTVAGAQRALFPGSLMGTLYRLTGGVPRVINLLCDRALLGVYARGKERVDRATLMQAAREVLPRGGAASWGLTARWAAAVGVVLICGGALALATYQQQDWWKTKPVASAIVPASMTPSTTSLEPMAEKPASFAPSEPPLAAKLEWPAQEPRSRSEALAYAALFRAWGIGEPGANPCREAPQLGLRCKSGRAGLDEVRTANRPAVFRLRDEQGQFFYATLVALDAKHASFAIGSVTVTVPLDSLSAQWSGEFTLLWRGPPDGSEAIRASSRGPTVAWLAKQLAQAQGAPADGSASEVFDEALAQRVRAFQLDQGLTPDGAVGPQTLIRLSAVADRSAPSLLKN